MNKKKLLIGTIFIIIVVVVIVFVQRQQSSPAGPTVSPTLAPLAPMGVFTLPTNVTFSFSSPPAIPASLPTYTFQQMPLAAVEQVAAKAALPLGLDATPSALTRGGSYTKTWSRPNEAALTVTQTNGNITITFRQAKIIQWGETLTPDIAVQQFLLLLVPPTPNLSVRAAGSVSGPFDGLLVLDTPPPSSFTNYFYSYALGTYPILTSDLSRAPASVIADSGGIIRFANIVPPSSSFQVGASVSLLTPDQVLASLAAGRGTLLDTHNPQTPDQGVVPNFSKFVIKTSQIVYAPQGKMLLPALYLTGTGTATGGATQEATIFLWLSPEGTNSQL